MVQADVCLDSLVPAASTAAALESRLSRVTRGLLHDPSRARAWRSLVLVAFLLGASQRRLL